MATSPPPPPPTTATDRARRALSRFIDPVTATLQRLGVTPNAVTVAGLFVAAGVGALAAVGSLLAAGLVFAFSAAFDGLDGSLARRIGITSKFGAFLDSTIDRYSEGLVLLGLLIYAHSRGLWPEEVLVMITLVGSFMISYTRSRAESLGVDCKVGLLTRMERYVLMTAMLLLSSFWAPALTLGLVLFAALTHFTVLQRVRHVRRTMRDKGL